MVRQAPFRWLFGDQPPAARLAGWQVRRLLGLGVMLRWASAALAAVTGLINGPRPFGVLVALILAVAVYNSVLTLAIRRADETGSRNLMRTAMVLDQFFAFAAVAVFSGQPQGAAPYLFVTLEAAICDGVAGGIMSLILFVVLELAFQGTRQALLGVPFNTAEVIVFPSVVGLAAAAFIGVTNILTGRDHEVEAAGSPAVAPNGSAPAVHLSRREREIVQLIASGYSNGMIASHLHLSESTVKSYVEMLLNRLKVRNRSEAVAAASRLNLL
jgi:DNA-binding CsgD family transcriptional regulator